MTLLKDIVTILEKLAPPAYQESYDNSGLLVGDPQMPVSGILVSLDVTESVVREAAERGCNLIVAHHPIVFKGLKRLTGKNYVERTVIKAIKHDVAIYAIHTNLDNVAPGVNHRLATEVGLQQLRILSPKKQTLRSLVTFVPMADTQRVLQALYAAGAGQIGHYKNCSFRSEGTGTFQPDEAASPHIGQALVQEEVTENRLELVFPAHLEGAVMRALRQAHPYEEIAYYITSLENENQEVGSGMLGELAEAMDELAFLRYLKERLQLGCIRHTDWIGRPVRRVAVCGGAGSFLLGDAIRQGADVFITADFKYHEFFDAEGKILIADIGHYESEVFTKNLLAEHLLKKIPNIAVILSSTATNPVKYL